MQLLNPRDRQKFWLSVAIQMALSFLDLAGVLLVGLVGMLSVVALDPSSSIPSTAAGVIKTLGFQERPLIELITLSALVAGVFLTSKSIAAVYLIRRVFRFLAGRQAQVAERLAGELFSMPLSFVQKRTSQETAYALMEGTIFGVLILLGNLALALSDITLLVILTLVLVSVNPVITLAALAFFAFLAFLLQRVLGTIARRAGADAKDANLSGLSAIQETLSTYREASVGARRSLFRDRFSLSMWNAADALASIQLVAQVPKFVFETALVVGALALLAAQSGFGDPAAAVGSIALFMAAGARVMPSLLRLQVSLINIRQAEGRAQPTYNLQKDLESCRQNLINFDLESFEKGVRTRHAGFSPELVLENVTFTYEGSPKPTVKNVSFRVTSGSAVAIAGPTGAGKSTIVDIMLGLLEPDEGLVLIGGMSPRNALDSHPGALAYVPQTVSLVAGTVRDNVALGIPAREVDESRVWEALDGAHLSEFLQSSREGLDTIVGEGGVRLSGGQKQRLGLARALYSRPALLVLDEATSALDADTERAITDTLAMLRGKTTTVTIAHRLATIRSADHVVYLEDGYIKAQGTFASVRAENTDFDRQATTLGL